VEDHVDVGGEVVVEHRGLDELHRGIEILGRSEIGVVNGDHVVVRGEAVREVRTDEARTARHEDALIVHGCVLSGQGHYGTGSSYLVSRSPEDHPNQGFGQVRV